MKFVIVILAFCLVNLSSLSSFGQEIVYTPKLDQSPLIQKVPLPLRKLVPISQSDRVERGLVISIDPESLIIKEICTEENLPYCTFRAPCGGVKVKFHNYSPYPTTIEEITFERIAKGGDVIAQKIISLPKEKQVIQPWMETESDRRRCECNYKKDPYCATDFPRIASPFSLLTFLKISVKYKNNDEYQTVQSQGEYELVRDE
ncbi:MAG: hypothetical protein A3F89_04435 [Deltaproteobacteria bacterium RIFCSPLOWO2_12_FULL_50_11]|nr:MAG: hypothetical protein A3F89_04435 [Deltaproteobacteria bacterium RIFCSPLOWO2_12_FULL_50_11]